MARCKDCIDYDECKKLGEKHWEDYPYPDEVNNVEELCGAFEIKTEREKDMVSCKECANGEVCGDVMDKGAEKCEVYTARNEKISEIAPSAEWQKEKEAEETTLKIKAAGYDAVKNIVIKHQELNMSNSDAMCHICGALIMEETIMNALI